MKNNHAIELLEQRRLLAVVINNGLRATDPSYFEVTIGDTVSDNGKVTSIKLGGTESLNEYTSFLDLGADETTGGTQVVELSNFAGSVSRISNSAASFTFRFVIADTNDTQDPLFLDNPIVTGTVVMNIPAGTSQLLTQVTVSGVGDVFRADFNLNNVNFFQYWDGQEAPATDDFLVVDGLSVVGDFDLRVHDTSTSNFSRTKNGKPSPDSLLAGFAAGAPADLRTSIVGGGYLPPATGDITVPAGNFPGLGSGYGPIPEIATALRYTVNNANQATFNTSLELSPGVQGPLMEVFYVQNFGVSGSVPVEIRVPDGTTTKSTLLGTDFGTLLTQPQQGTHYFVIRNRGMGELDLYGNPRVNVIGDRNDFRVTRLPIETVMGGGFTYFSITYVPTSSGLRQATISIVSNDPSTTPYTFKVYGGEGSTILPDVYEPDGDGDIPSQRFPARSTSDFPGADPSDPMKFIKYQGGNPSLPLAKTISTDGVWKVHTIHKSNDIDWSTFTLTQDSDVLIRTTVAQGDTRMYIFDSKGNFRGYDNDSGEGLASAYHFRMEAGTYFIRIDEYGNNATIPIYGLSVVAKPTTITQRDLPVYLNRGYKRDLVTGNWVRDFAVVVIGRQVNDVIAADVVAGSLRITLNDSAVYFPLRDVDRIYIESRGGNDTVFIAVATPPAVIYGAGGDDSITIDPRNAKDMRIYGGEGHDIIFGGAGNDFINGGGGNDTIFAGEGNDLVQGGFGNDQIYGEGGNDTLLGQQNNDLLSGGTGDDLLIGDDAGQRYYGNDTIYGNEGNDTLNGGPGQDVLDSGIGNDVIYALDGYVDTIYANVLNNIDSIFMDKKSNGDLVDDILLPDESVIA